LVDQPGDDVSQNRISTDLISILRKMVEFKQVLFITHKPELVVNLDVDNVIVLKNDENNNLKVSYGALEYIDDEVNILDEVANTLDGGVEVIRKRWKRYDK
jgi:DNA repair ATPase RecN